MLQNKQQNNMAGSVAIRFCGVEFVLPSDLPFQKDGNCLTLDFSAGFVGKLTVLAGTLLDSSGNLVFTEYH